MSAILRTSTVDLLQELAADNPAPQEKWFHRDDFDPMHAMTDLRSAAKKGLIELEVNVPAEASRFRLTPAARTLLNKEGEK